MAADSDASAEEIRTLIEQLNNAIEHVNDVEDAHQACCARHAATLRALTCGMAALEAESKGTKWQAAAIAAAEACEAAAAAQQELAAAEQLQVVEATAAKMVSSARKVASNAASREEKARRILERLHGHESRRWTGAPASWQVPWEEDLAVVSRWLVVRDEVRKARQMETLELGESELLKEAAAAAVNAAMAALEEKSDEIHNQQTAEASERASEGAADVAAEVGGKRIRCSSDECGEGGKESAADGEPGSLVKKAGSSSRFRRIAAGPCEREHFPNLGARRTARGEAFRRVLRAPRGGLRHRPVAWARVGGHAIDPQVAGRGRAGGGAVPMTRAERNGARF